ncbi:MAG TPA: hypothetical protein VII59_03655, partial [Streptosporangiaceae bacterium]
MMALRAAASAVGDNGSNADADAVFIGPVESARAADAEPPAAAAASNSADAASTPFDVVSTASAPQVRARDDDRARVDRRGRDRAAGIALA